MLSLLLELESASAWEPVPSKAARTPSAQSRRPGIPGSQQVPLPHRTSAGRRRFTSWGNGGSAAPGEFPASLRYFPPLESFRGSKTHALVPKPSRNVARDLEGARRDREEQPQDGCAGEGARRESSGRRRGRCGQAWPVDSKDPGKVCFVLSAAWSLGCGQGCGHAFCYEPFHSNDMLCNGI